MKRAVNAALMVACAATMPVAVGCSGNPDQEYEKILREMAKDNNASCSVNVDGELKKFKALTPAEKEKELKETRAFYEAMKEGGIK